MSEASPSAHLRWPDEVDESTFLARHWQREPLLMRQALPGFRSPLPPDELAGLALEPDTTPRLIRRERAAGGAADRYTLEHGPFEADVFETLGARDWSLLVTDVEKHLPDLVDWIAPFRLAPDWRLDDLMISYAPDGASVGAHVDEYDVFLLQASGTRRWSITRPAEEAAGARPAPASARHDLRVLPDAFSPVREHRTLVGGDLALLSAFEPTDSWELVPGDVLYLPPGVPHHGVAVGEDCTTWSIGFRSPSAADVLLHVAEFVAERLPHARLRDRGHGRGEPGRIEADTVAAVRALWERATRLDEAAFVELTGRLLTRGGEAARAGEGSFGETGYRPSAFSRLAWSERADGEAEPERALLFVDGDCLTCSSAFARRVCDPGGAPLHSPSPHDSPAAPIEDDVAAFAALIERGALIRHDPDDLS